MFSMNKLNYLFYPFLLLLISLIIFVKDKSDQKNGVYENLHDQIKYKIIYNNQNTLNEKISAVYSLKNRNSKGKNKLIAKLSGKNIRKIKNIPMDKPSNPDGAAEYFLDQRRNTETGELNFESYIKYKDFFKDRESLDDILLPVNSREAQRSSLRTDDPCKAKGVGYQMELVIDDLSGGEKTGNGNFSSIVVHPTDESIVYVTISSWADYHVWKSADCGTTWNYLDGIRVKELGGDEWTTPIGGIPDIPVNHLFIDPLDTNRLFIATDLGVMYSANGGGSWTSINTNGMANVITERLDYNAGSRTLYAFTYGRGVFAIKLP